MDGKALEEWSNDEVRQALLASGEKDVPVTPTTRPLLLKKLRKLLDRPQGGLAESSNHQEEEDNSSANQSAPGTPSSQPTEEFEGYYGVAAAAIEERTTSLQLSPFYTNKAEVLKAIKGLPGARFKRFESQKSAEAFSLNPGSEPNSTGVTPQLASSPASTPDTSERPNNFPGLKTQDLTRFRTLIEKGNVAEFKDTVWSNPRYLISSGDSPVILQIGFRYNALHCAVLARSLDACRELFVILESERFWTLVYPDDSVETRDKRRSHLIDLYLNMQDKIRNETPLHFASKFGYKEIVSFLMSFPATRTDLCNQDKETPADVACKKAKNAEEGLKRRVQELLQGRELYYVPVLRAVDNSIPPQLGSPCTREECMNGLVGAPSESPVTSQAFAGPMSPAKADEFYYEWKSPARDQERKAASHIKRSDPSKGWERIGRKMAAKEEVKWLEYWEFLGCYCSLSKQEGLQKLEQYLTDLHRSNQSPPDPAATQSPECVDEMTESPLPAVTEAADRLAEVFSSLEVSSTEQGDTDQSPPRLSGTRIPPANGFITPVRGVGRGWEGEGASVFLTGDAPTKLDYDVLLAVSDAPLGVDPKDFPHIHRWLELVRSYTEQERKSWRTPSSVHRHQNRTSSLPPASPLLFSSPTLSPLTPSHHHRPTPVRTTPLRPRPSTNPRLSAIATRLL